MADLDPTDQQWADRAAERLRQQEHDVSNDVNQRLQAARRAAVEAADEKSAAVDWWPRAAGAGTAAMAIMVAALVLYSPIDPLPRIEASELAAAQEAELLEELEFVAWMIAMEEADAIPAQG